MLGAIIGDMVGSIYEFNNIKDKRFFFLTKYSTITDDSVMTMAVARALIDCAKEITTKADGYEKKLYDKCIEYMVYYGKRFPNVGYGGHFSKWLIDKNRVPYGSYGNGSAMRVSPVGWFCDSLEDTLHIAEITASPSHNHEEGIKGAQAIAAGIYLLRTGSNKEEVKKYITGMFGYDLDRKLDDIRPDYTFHVSCQKSVPEAFIAFLEGNSFEDVIRNAVSLGGDSDTIACMAGALAETIYEIPASIRDSAMENLIDQHEVSRKDFDFYNTFVVEKKNPTLGDQSFKMPDPWEIPIEKPWIEEFLNELTKRLKNNVEKAFGRDERIGTVEFTTELAKEAKKLMSGKGCDKRLFEIAEYYGYLNDTAISTTICTHIIENGRSTSVINKAKKIREDMTLRHYISCGIVE